jgi:Zn-dependent peptidase ImmA (M78 family)/transcriptional regulator with XRE-family HTH domain
MVPPEPERKVVEIDPRKVVVAREARDLTQGELAERLGTSQAKVSRIESGMLPVTEQGLAKIAAALKYRPSFFCERDELYGMEMSIMYHRSLETSLIYHRKQQTIPIRTLNRIHADLNIRRIHIERFLRAARVQPVKQFPCFDIDEYDSPEDVAQAVRATWLLPRGPVDNMTKTIEDAGGIIIKVDFGTRQIDAVSQWIPGKPPMFFVNRDLPGDRLRLSLAHELGHITMHRVVNPHIEEQAFAFAAAFLMPRDTILPTLHGVTPARLATLKPYWKVSMQAILKRASDLQAITPRQARYVWMQLSRAGYRLREPAELDIPVEEPRLLREMVELHAERLGYSVEDLGELTGLYSDELTELYLPKATGLRAVQGGRRRI